MCAHLFQHVHHLTKFKILEQVGWLNLVGEVLTPRFESHQRGLGVDFRCL